MLRFLSSFFEFAKPLIELFKKSPEQKERDRIKRSIDKTKTNIKQIVNAISKAKSGNSRDLEKILGL